MATSTAATTTHLVKVGLGFYTWKDRYVIAHTPDGWRWYLLSDAHVGGDWRRTRADAVADVVDYDAWPK